MEALPRLWVAMHTWVTCAWVGWWCIGDSKLLELVDDGGANETTMTSDEDLGGLVRKERVHSSSVTRASHCRRLEWERERE